MATVDEAAAGAAAAFWVEQTASQVAGLTDAAAQQAADVWAGFASWYTPAAVAAQAALAAEVSRNAQDVVTQLMAQYLGEMTAILADTRGVKIPRIVTPEIRNGADPVAVHSRTAKAYRVDYAKTQDDTAAIAAAMAREMSLIEADLMLAARQAQADAMAELDVERYRRILRPELSVTGSCGLCLAASLQVYTIGQLLPIHVRCKCLTMPIIGGVDPAKGLNEEDRNAAYAEAGETGKSALSNVRVQVHEHGELGPVLTVKGQKFTGPKDLAEKGSGGGDGRPPARSATGVPEDDGSRHLPVDESVVFSRQLIRDPALNPVVSYADLEQRGLLAGDDPYEYFDEGEQSVVDWLARRGVSNVRSVRQVQDIRTPDSVLDGVAVTVEIKTLKSVGTETAIYNAIRSARGQSKRIIIDGRRQGVEPGAAARGIRKALGVYGEELVEVIVILGDRTSVGWWHGRR
ncbi:hypothetical protein EFK50_01090 [Nocardioides marmoriginsengisoli]|uniref:tRNA nuclease CdiA C-terminal domain-containing protein n=1 Tax=Nocardioides marmoriginsengisoli TaxID=661483 RepID=A0A3N0CSK8_9ACTN|nr:hypothetical protein [Nocardioides marmoriginsengisoli]RNL66251.1 hypothetical protein EFK50_01090 [Nocardioides marmoriginsengisoli]